MPAETEKPGWAEKIQKHLILLRQNIIPIQENDSSIKRWGKNIGFVSIVILFGVLTIVLATVISFVL